MAFDIGGGITGGLTGFAAGGPIGAGLGALAGGFLAGDAPSFQAPQFQPIEGIGQVAPTGLLQPTTTGFAPGGVQTGQAGVTVGPDGQLISGLTGQAAASQQQLFGLGTGFLDQAGTFDPDAFGANVTDRLRNLAAPQEERDRLALENRLSQQGLLSSTPGADRFESLLTAQNLADEARVARGFSLGQDVQGNLLQRGGAALQQGFGMEQLGTGLFGTSLQIGQGGLAGDQLGFNQQLGAAELDFQSRLQSGDLELRNQLAQQGNINAFNQASAANQYLSDQGRSDIGAALGSGILGGLGAFEGTGGGNSLSTGFENFFGGTDFSDADLDFFNTFDIGE